MAETMKMARQGLSDPEICRVMQWRVGTRLVGNEGRGTTVIQLTAIGERLLLAKIESHNGRPESSPIESIWTLSVRDWAEAPR